MLKIQDLKHDSLTPQKRVSESRFIIQLEEFMNILTNFSFPMSLFSILLYLDSINLTIVFLLIETLTLLLLTGTIIPSQIISTINEFMCIFSIFFISIGFDIYLHHETYMQLKTTVNKLPVKHFQCKFRIKEIFNFCFNEKNKNKRLLTVYREKTPYISQ